MKITTLIKVSKIQIQKIKLMNQHDIIHFGTLFDEDISRKECIHCNKILRFPFGFPQKDIVVFFNHHKTCKRYIFDILLNLKN